MVMQKRLAIYRVEDLFCARLPSMMVNLIITSPSIENLSSKRLTRLFEICDDVTLSDGLLLIDVPGQYNEYTINLWEVERGTAWYFQWGLAFYDFYKVGDTQFLCAFAKNRAQIHRPSEISYRRCYERQMSHPCEFDEVWVESLIELYTKPGAVVLDPFCGTGTVPITAYNLNRVGIGIDKR